MASSGEEYLIARQKQIDRRKRIVTWISIISFAGSGMAAVVPALQKMTHNETQQQAESPEASLKQQARGFELVLQREPENVVALEGLVRIRLQLKDFQGATPSLEKLVKLQPERQEYKALLEQLKTNVGQKKQPSSKQTKPN
ncbi:tetratricopeptide repeat protein [Scytonema sp. UIC 10036]|uniref:tetratricopeptide repeat protein n=1 Tax=Scytonema sp. UIC 10036 TaxID=2304196 RepID=UPI0012DA1EAA|nr:tetratricopeptide repeat protein [Scytonema sp. UIC 10036]MUG97030.1 tetratricopeptide repeat protein [Scytonema sp. UIC 10036]